MKKNFGFKYPHWFNSHWFDLIFLLGIGGMCGIIVSLTEDGVTVERTAGGICLFAAIISYGVRSLKVGEK